MPKMIIVADSTRARVFTAESATSPLLEIETLANPDGRLHDRDITSDSPGRDSGGKQSSAHAYQPETDPKEYRLAEFAKRLARYLDDIRKENKLTGLLLVAAPEFLGGLRANLSNEVKSKIVFELDKNLTRHSNEDIRKHLPEFLTH